MTCDGRLQNQEIEDGSPKNPGIEKGWQLPHSSLYIYPMTPWIRPMASNSKQMKHKISLKINFTKAFAHYFHNLFDVDARTIVCHVDVAMASQNNED